MVDRSSFKLKLAQGTSEGEAILVCTEDKHFERQVGAVRRERKRGEGIEDLSNVPDGYISEMK